MLSKILRANSFSKFLPFSIFHVVNGLKIHQPCRVHAVGDKFISCFETFFMLKKLCLLSSVRLEVSAKLVATGAAGGRLTSLAARLLTAVANFGTRVVSCPSWAASLALVSGFSLMTCCLES